MKAIMHMGMAALAAAVLSGCAGMAFNRIDLTLNRNITVGQELVDLQTAHEKGVINDTEYAKAKQNILDMVDAFGDLKKDK
ncbi:MAG: hypothetical protein K9M54_04975 [Kiritimatiellales bacterium]|nr:hypothetical protein [Kiritimatiellales bacterium]MCF7863366.1 hypothetical protein [Kiritimatiellales bacterium]